MCIVSLRYTVLLYTIYILLGISKDEILRDASILQYNYFGYDAK